jgi:tellurite resistance protein TerC
MDVAPEHWAALIGLVVALFVFDLAVSARRSAPRSFRRLTAINVAWTMIGLGFGGVVLALYGGEQAGAYVTGYLVERSLSLDNVAVFAMVFTALAVPMQARERILGWGIALALVLRVLLILVGVALIDAFAWVVIVFGVFLLWTAWRMRSVEHEAQDPTRSRAYRLLARVVPMAPGPAQDRLFTRVDGRLMGTSLLAAFLLVAVMDVVFAVDSVPAILAITRETYLVVAANAFALLGLRPLFLLVDGALRSVVELQQALAVILAWIGFKLIASYWWHLPAWASLIVILAILAQAGVRAVRRQRREAALLAAARESAPSR